MNLFNSASPISRIMAYLLVCTLIISFGAIGSVLAKNFGDAYSFVGLFLGSALGAFIAVYESTIIGCLIGMIIGVVISPIIYYLIDFETAYLAIFISSLIGAILGEPVASFWQEADDSSYNNQQVDEYENTTDSTTSKTNDKQN